MLFLNFIFYICAFLKNGLKQGDALWPLLFNISLEYTIKRLEVNQNGLKLNGTQGEEKEREKPTRYN